METSGLKLDLKFDYDSLTLPDKIIIPIEHGKFGPLEYKQHETDPLAIEQLKIGYAGPEQVQLNLRITGRITVNNFPDLKLGGTYITINAELSQKGKNILIQNPTLSHIDLPSVPDFADDFIQKIINKNILAKLMDHFSIDLTPSIKAIEKAINTPVPFKVTVLAERQEYEFDVNGTISDTVLRVLPEYLHCETEINFMPKIKNR